MEQRIMKMKNAKIREENGKRYLEGYFSIFGEPYQVWDGWIETIERGAFARYLASGNDVKVLWNHDSNIVLGSTGNGTASLIEDETGLFGSVEINENDSEAVSAYARVARGDVDGCSFGFDIGRQEEWWDEEGIYHTKITEVDPLFEVSPCTFPAYKATSISARAKDSLEDARKRYEQAQNQKRNEWRDSMKTRLKGEKEWH